MKSELECPCEDKKTWEKFIKPEGPDMPLIRVWENYEQGCFEAAFALVKGLIEHAGTLGLVLFIFGGVTGLAIRKRRT